MGASALTSQVMEPDHLFSRLWKEKLEQMCTEMFIVFKYDLHLQFHDLNYFHMVLVNRICSSKKKKKRNNHCKYCKCRGAAKWTNSGFFIHLNKREETCCQPRLDLSERNSVPARYLPKSSRVGFSFFIDIFCCSGLVLQLSGLGYSLPSSCFSLPQPPQPNLSLGLKCGGRHDRQVQADALLHECCHTLSLLLKEAQEGRHLTASTLCLVKF